MLAMIILPAAITLNAVRLPGELQIREEENPTPYGYSWSLLLFIVSILVIAFVFLPRAEIKIPRKAFWWTVGILAPIGCATDFCFASRFFVFKNPGATLRIEAPALNKPVPVESGHRFLPLRRRQSNVGSSQRFSEKQAFSSVDNPLYLQIGRGRTRY